MSTLQSHFFGTTQTGAPVTRYLLKDGTFELGILDYGGAVQMLRVPDRNGSSVDVVLGLDSVEAYEIHGKFFGALIGRCANRIANGAFTLNDTAYHLPQNEGENHLHGGNGFDRKIWHVQPAIDGLQLTLHSENGEEGYPGNLDVTVTYTLKDGALILDYHAVSDADTLCNLTNHTYFNLSGHASGSVEQQYIQLFSESYTPTDRFSIPTGEIVPVDGTPLDLRKPQRIGQNIDAGFEQLRFAGGFDHNWLVAGSGSIRRAATAFSEDTGIHMQVETTMPGIQFYSGNYLDGCPSGKDGATYTKRCGFCLETQFYPDAIHHPQFPQPILRKGETYSQQTIYHFSTTDC